MLVGFFSQNKGYKNVNYRGEKARGGSEYLGRIINKVLLLLLLINCEFLLLYIKT